MTDIFFYNVSFYNRRHSTLGYVSPLAYEASYQEHGSTTIICVH